MNSSPQGARTGGCAAWEGAPPASHLHRREFCRATRHDAFSQQPFDRCVCLRDQRTLVPPCFNLPVARMALALRRLAVASLRPLRVAVPARSSATTASSATVIPKAEYATWDEQPVDVTFGEVSTASYRLRNGVQKTLMHHSRKMSQLLVRRAGGGAGVRKSEDRPPATCGGQEWTERLPLRGRASRHSAVDRGRAHLSRGVQRPCCRTARCTSRTSSSTPRAPSRSAAGATRCCCCVSGGVSS